MSTFASQIVWMTVVLSTDFEAVTEWTKKQARRDLAEISARDLAEIVRDPPFAEIVVTLGEVHEGWPGSGDLHVAIHAR